MSLSVVGVKTTESAITALTGRASNLLSVTLPGKPRNSTSTDLSNFWGDAHPDAGEFSFSLVTVVEPQGQTSRRSQESAAVIVRPYHGIKLNTLERFTPVGRATNIPAFRIGWSSAGFDNNTTVPLNNAVADYKLAAYLKSDLAIDPDSLPVAGTIREYGQTMSPSGAHYIPTDYDINDSNILTQEVIFDENLNDTTIQGIIPGGDTQGLLRDGDYEVRARVRDLYGNIIGSIRLDTTMNRRDAPSGDIIPRAYRYNPTGTDILVPGTTGLVNGHYVGLSFRAGSTFPSDDDFSGPNTEGGYLLVERREFSHPERPANLTPKPVGGRVYLRDTGGSPGAYTPSPALRCYSIR